MNYKKPILIAILILAAVLAMANTSNVDCFVDLTYDVNAALSEYHEDLAWCEANSGIYINACEYEANLAFNSTIDSSLDDFERCCCVNAQGCCLQ